MVRERLFQVRILLQSPKWQCRWMRSCAVLLVVAVAAASADKKILVYTRNFTLDGKGYVHDNVQHSVAAIKKMGEEADFAVEVSSDPTVFTAENLRKYKTLVFCNSNNEAFADDAQRQAFRGYIRSGGGFVGIHSATGSERKWEYYWLAIGGSFVRHARIQKFTVRVQDPTHPSTRGLPVSFEWTDECYYHDKLNPDIKPLLVTDPSKIDDPKKAEYPGDRFGDTMPLAWYNTFDGGRQFYTALGHNKEHYSNAILCKHILGGILWTMGEAK